MRPILSVLTALACASAIGGCSIAGSWRATAITPPGAPFPVEHVTFDRDSHYTASWEQDGRRCTSTGSYRFDGFSLEILQPGSLPRVYDARLRLDGKLVLTYAEGDAKVSAVLEKVKPSSVP